VLDNLRDFVREVDLYGTTRGPDRVLVLEQIRDGVLALRSATECRDGLSPRIPVPVDANGWLHYVEGGHTAVKLDDAPGRPGTGGLLINSTREHVIDGAPPIPEGSVVFQVAPDGVWLPLRRFP
jgi:hypothetical protein